MPPRIPVFAGDTILIRAVIYSKIGNLLWYPPLEQIDFFISLLEPGRVHIHLPTDGNDFRRTHPVNDGLDRFTCFPHLTRRNN